MLNPHIERWPSSKPVHVGEDACDRLPMKWGEVDAEIAREALAEIDRDPKALVRGPALARRLAKILPRKKDR